MEKKSTPKDLNVLVYKLGGGYIGTCDVIMFYTLHIFYKAFMGVYILLFKTLKY